MRRIEQYLALTLLFFLTAMAHAGDCCEHCGCEACVHRVCHVKCEIKKVPKTCWSCECEDFCVPGPSKRCGCKTETDCNGCTVTKPNYVPTCAEVRTRHKLVKKTIYKEELTYTWVVEYLCDQCTKCANAENRPQPGVTADANATQPTLAETVATPAGGVGYAPLPPLPPEPQVSRAGYQQK